MAKTKSYMRSYRLKKKTQAVNAEAAARMQAGEMPSSIPGTRYPDQMRAALDLIHENYRQSQEMTGYMAGAYPNGIPHYEMRQQQNGTAEQFQVRMGNLTTRYVTIPSGLSPEQRRAYMDFHIYGAYQNAKKRNLL